MTAKAKLMVAPLLSLVEARPYTPPGGTPMAHERMLRIMSQVEGDLSELLAAFSDDSTPDLTDGIYDEDEDLPPEHM